MALKLSFHFQLINFLEKIFKEISIHNYNKCCIWRNLCCLSKKNNSTLIFLLSNCLRVLTIFYDWQVKYYFWRFRIWLLRYRIKLNCLYIPQRHFFISTLWLRFLEVQMNMLIFNLEWKSIFKDSITFIVILTVLTIKSNQKAYPYWIQYVISLRYFRIGIIFLNHHPVV